MSNEGKIGNRYAKLAAAEITEQAVAAIERRILDEATTWEVQFDGGPGEVVSVSDAAHVAARYAESRRAEALAEHPEARCHRCGGPNIVWNAPSPLWNAVMRGGSINGEDEFDGIVCPVCFASLADERGVTVGRWRLFSEYVLVDLETVTPSGRVWDERVWLWRDAPSAPSEPLQDQPRVWELPTIPEDVTRLRDRRGKLVRRVSVGWMAAGVPIGVSDAWLINHLGPLTEVVNTDGE